MAKKRFTDIEIWDKEWFMELSPTLKCLIKYMFDKCDAAGCWKPNWKLASLHINDVVQLSDLSLIPKDQYEILPNGKIYIPDFIKFQYGTLSEKSPAHNPVFFAIEKNNLSNRVFNRVQSTLKEEDIYMEEEIEREKDKGGTGGIYGGVSKITDEGLWTTEKNSFLTHGGWIFKFCSEKNIKSELFDKMAAEFIADIELKEDFKTAKELRSHFTNWFNLKKKVNGKHSYQTEQQSSSDLRQQVADEHRKRSAARQQSGG